MKYQPINNYPSFDLPPISQEIISDMMRKQGKHPAQIMSPIDYGIKIKRNEPMRETELSTAEILNLFDKKEALCFVYIPHFVTQCVMFYLEKLIAYMVEHRMQEFKKHTRALRAMQDEYMLALRHEMPNPVFRKFLDQRDEYINSCFANLQIMYFTFANELSKQYGHIDHECAYCYACIIYRLTRYIEEHDKKVNRTIAERVGKPVRNYGDERLAIIKRVCEDIMQPYKIDSTEQTKMAIQVIVNKAIYMINAMYEERK